MSENDAKLNSGDASKLSPDALLRRMMVRGGPMAPDRPRGFNPNVHRQAILEAPIIFAKLPDGMQVLLYSRVDGREVDFIEVMSGGLPRDTPVLWVRCEDQEDVDWLRAFIADLKG
jgi:hypothetical protein